MKKYIDSFVNYRFLLSELVKKGIKLKYRRSYLGIIWSLLEPLCTMIVLTVVFGTILGNRTKEFSVYILCGRLLFSFYSTATKAALTSIRKNASMIKKVYVPKYLYTLSDTSKWNKKRNENLNTRLTNALKDSNPMLKVAYTSDEIEQIRKTVKGKGYRITNSLNKNITKEW